MDIEDRSSRRRGILSELKEQSTGRLLLMDAFSAGLYTAYYIRRQSRRLEALLGEKNRLDLFQKVAVCFAWLNVLCLVISYLVFETDSRADKFLSWIMPAIYFAVTIAWALEARVRLNALLSATKSDGFNFNLFWTFFFQEFYINYKINLLYNRIAAEDEYCVSMPMPNELRGDSLRAITDSMGVDRIITSEAINSDNLSQLIGGLPEIVVKPRIGRASLFKSVKFNFLVLALLGSLCFLIELMQSAAPEVMSSIQKFMSEWHLNALMFFVIFLLVGTFEFWSFVIIGAASSQRYWRPDAIENASVIFFCILGIVFLDAVYPLVSHWHNVDFEFYLLLSFAVLGCQRTRERFLSSRYCPITGCSLDPLVLAQFRICITKEVTGRLQDEDYHGALECCFSNSAQGHSYSELIIWSAPEAKVSYLELRICNPSLESPNGFWAANLMRHLVAVRIVPSGMRTVYFQAFQADSKASGYIPAGT